MKRLPEKTILKIPKHPNFPVPFPCLFQCEIGFLEPSNRPWSPWGCRPSSLFLAAQHRGRNSGVLLFVTKSLGLQLFTMELRAKIQHLSRARASGLPAEAEEQEPRNPDWAPERRHQTHRNVGLSSHPNQPAALA